MLGFTEVGARDLRETKMIMEILRGRSETHFSVKTLKTTSRTIPMRIRGFRGPGVPLFVGRYVFRISF